METDDLHRERALIARLAALPGVTVAFSGGVDSSYVLWATLQAQPTARMRTVIGVSPSLATAQLGQARAVAAHLGAPLTEIETAETERAEYQANRGDRCFFCKDTLYETMAALPFPGDWPVVDGTNADDLGGHRPGRAAGQSHRVLSPLVDVGLGKPAIRRLSRRAGLPTADLPASPCLASRFPAGVPVSVAALRQVEAAEAAVRAHGFTEFRVRHHGDLARIEVPVDDLPRLASGATREAITAELTALGYRFVALDLLGFRSGSGSTL